MDSFCYLCFVSVILSCLFIAASCASFLTCNPNEIGNPQSKLKEEFALQVIDRF